MELVELLDVVAEKVCVMETRKSGAILCLIDLAKVQLNNPRISVSDLVEAGRMLVTNCSQGPRMDNAAGERMTRDDFVDTAEPYLPCYNDIRKLEKVFREDPDKVYAFIDGLPEPDMTVVGASVEKKREEIVCIRCLTEAELQVMRGGDDVVSGMCVSAISRDDADDSDYVCERCAKEL